MRQSGSLNFEPNSMMQQRDATGYGISRSSAHAFQAPSSSEIAPWPFPRLTSDRSVSADGDGERPEPAQVVGTTADLIDPSEID